MSERKMASIRRIDRIDPIEGADAIEVATVGGWKVVTKKGEFSPGDLAIYCEIDSWIPHELAPFLSRGKEPREFNGVKGERLRTVKLRGQISQGLLLPWTAGDEGEDVSEVLNIQKWEMPVPAQLAGEVRGTFPSEIPKTDQERVQNLTKEIEKIYFESFEVTEKLEGSSMTCYLIRGEFGVCSRNLDLKRNENNAFWKVAIEQDIEAKMRKVDADWDWAIQGELIGPGIQGNIYNLSQPDFYVYDVYDIMNRKYLISDARTVLIHNMGLKHVPVIYPEQLLENKNIDWLLQYAEGKSILNLQQEREGIVFKNIKDPEFTFKVVSNRYLMGHK